MTFPTFYTVITGHHGEDMATGGDPTPKWDRAYDQYSDAVGAGETEARVYVMDPDTGTGSDVTAEFAAELEMICERRGLPAPFATPVCPDCDNEVCTCDDAYEARDMRIAAE